VEVGDVLAKWSPRMLTIGFGVVDGAKNFERRGVAMVVSSGYATIVP
jgi:hypothetical protein